MDDRALYISNYAKEIVVPLANVAAGLSWRVVRLEIPRVK